MDRRMCDVQAAREAAAPPPRDWNTLRAACIESGMVEERRQQRERDEDEDGSRISAYLGLGDENAPEAYEWPW